jgi:hypothetical protein
MLAFFTLIKPLLSWKLALAIVVSLLIWGLWHQTVKLKETETDRDRISDNFKKSNFNLDSIKQENGKLVYSVNSLTVTQDEFEAQNILLATQLKTAKVQIKNLVSASQIDTHYEVNVDSIASSADTLSKAEILAHMTLDTAKSKSTTIFGFIPKYNVNFFDQWASIQQTINVPFGKNPYITGLKIRLTDSLTISHEMIKKRVWLFWHKNIGVKTHIMSPSPYFHVDKIQDYLFIK